MKIIPFGDRILVRRKKIEESRKDSKILLPDATSERPTDLAVIKSIPDLSLADQELISESRSIISSLTKKAAQGDSDALLSLLNFNKFLKVKSLKIGDTVMISQYVGVTFGDSENKEQDQTIVSSEDIMGVVGE